MKPIVLNRYRAERFKSAKPYVMISITDPKQGEARLLDDSNRIETLRLTFHDLDAPLNGYKLFSTEDADAILLASAVSPDVQIVVHCEAGISRSAAVAAALARISGENDRPYFDAYLPNRLVYRTLLERGLDTE